MASYDIPFPLPLQYLARRPLFALGIPTDHLDGQGAPVMEGLSRRFPRPASDLMRCPYADHRSTSAKPMNVRALSEYRAGRSSSVDLLRRVCGAVGEGVGVKNSKTSEWQRVWAVAATLRTYPLNLSLGSILAGDDPKPTPSDVAMLFKIFRGVHQLIASVPDIDRHVPQLSGEAMYAFLDQSRSLIGATEVCAAPPRLIIEFFDVLAETIESSKRCDDSDLRDVVTFAIVYEAWESIAFLLEACRCARLVSLPGRDESRTALTKCRHTFRGASVANAVGLGNRNLDRNHFERQRAHLEWTGASMEWAAEMYSGIWREADAFLASSTRESAAWDLIVDRSLIVANEFNEALASAFTIVPAKLGRRDLHNYFGQL